MKVYDMDRKTKQYRNLIPVGTLRPFVEKPLRVQIEDAMGLVNRSEYLAFSKEDIAKITALNDQVIGGMSDPKTMLEYVIRWLTTPGHYSLTEVREDDGRDQPPAWLWAIQKT